MNLARGVVIPLVLFATTVPALAQVYRSVDPQGNVIFSDAPPENAVEVAPVEIQPAPSEAQVRETRERLDAQRDALETQRATREAEEARRREARQQQREARAQREAAQRAQTQASDPDARAWWYRGQAPPPRPQPPIAQPPVNRPRPGGGDHPAFAPSF